MSIHMSNVNSFHTFTLYAEDGSGIVDDIYRAFEHIGAIQRFIEERIEIESFNRKTILVILTELQVQRLAIQAPIEEKVRADDEVTKSKFSELYQIIDKLKE